MKIYNKLSNEYDALYLKNIENFIEKYNEITEENIEFVDFYPSFGVKKGEKTDFITYGQAVNGWGASFSLKEELEKDKIIESLKASNSFLASKGHNPLDWVNIQWSAPIYNEETEDVEVKDFYKEKYKANRSFFWQVTYRLIDDYYGLDRASFEWSSKMVWSNLYKIAPNGANPSGLEKEIQQPLSAELVKKEMDELKPKFCVVLTNEKWWIPFRETIQTESIPYDDSLDIIECVEKYNSTKIIVTKRPRFGSIDDYEKYVKQILSVIKS